MRSERGGPPRSETPYPAECGGRRGRAPRSDAIPAGRHPPCRHTAAPPLFRARTSPLPSPSVPGTESSARPFPRPAVPAPEAGVRHGPVPAAESSSGDPRAGRPATSGGRGSAIHTGPTATAPGRSRRRCGRTAARRAPAEAEGHRPRPRGSPASPGSPSRRGSGRSRGSRRVPNRATAERRRPAGRPPPPIPPRRGRAGPAIPRQMPQEPKAGPPPRRPGRAVAG
jgi:hypothetical protein